MLRFLLPALSLLLLPLLLAGPYASVALAADQVTVPPLVGKSPEEARTALEALGLSPVLVAVAGPPPGKVERLEPAAGAKVAVGAPVIVRYGIALRLETKAPDLVGRLLPDVGPEVEGAYTLEVELVLNPQLSEGRILEQKPAAGQPLWYRGVLQLKVATLTPPAGSTAIVPPLVGLQEAEALEQLNAVGLAHVIDHRPDAPQPSGTVLSQDPRTGVEILAGGTVYLTVAGAHETHALPDAGSPAPQLVGLEMNAALNAVHASGFVPALKLQAQVGHPAWTVIAQDPAQGTLLPAGATITFTVALPGPQPAQVILPSLFGLTQQQAEALLSSLQLVAQVQLEPAGFPAGRVFAQSPQANTTVAKGSQVLLRVAQGGPPPGLPQVNVPVVVGLAPALAWQKLALAGVTPKGLQHLAPGKPVDVVDAQFPAPGTLVPPGTEVRFYAPLAAIVPGLLGKTRTQAIQSLTAAGFNADPQGPNFGLGTTVVIAQGAPAGVPLARGTTVPFAYKWQGGGGIPVKVQIPDLQGLTLNQATQALQQKGLGVDPERQGPIQPGPGTKVVAQLPAAGLFVPPGTVIKVIYVEIGILVPSVQVPPVVGKTLAQAQAIVEGAGLTHDAHLQGPNLPFGTKKVVSQNPSAGSLVPSGTKVHLTYTEQPGLGVQVPMLVGKSLADAQALVTGAGLTSDTHLQGPNLPFGTKKVVAQNPNAGVVVAPGTKVHITYVEQPGLGVLVNVPPLVGKTKAQAAAILGPLNLNPVWNGPGGNPNKLRVVLQQPLAGTKLAPGSNVTMVLVPIP